MAVSNYNIKQITNYDISDYPTVNYSITFPNGDVKTVPYITALDGSQIVKLGYCCEPKGITFAENYELEKIFPND